MRRMIVKIADITPEALGELAAFMASSENIFESNDLEKGWSCSGDPSVIKRPIVELKQLKGEMASPVGTSGYVARYSVSISVVVDYGNYRNHGPRNQETTKSKLIQKIWDMLGVFPTT